jgi:hypothetical protein
MESKLSDKKNVEILCKGYYKSLKCKSCKKYKQINDEILKQGKKNTRKITNKSIKLWQKYGKNCDKCTNSKKTKKCNPIQLKKYSNWYYYGKKFSV